MLTLSAGTEGAGGNLVAELATLLAAELLALLAGEQPLVLVHVLLILLGAGQVHERSRVAVVGSGLSTHRVEELGDLLLDDGVGRLLALGALLLLAHLLALLLLLDDLLLLPLLGLSLGEGGLGVHAGPESANVTLLGRDDRRLLSADGCGVDGRVGEEELGLGRRVKFHVHIQASGVLGRRGVEVKQVVLGAHSTVEVVQAESTVVASDLGVGLVHGQGVCESTGDDAGLLLVQLILMARAGQRL